MEYNALFWIIIFIVTGEYLLSQYLSLCNRRAASQELPELLAGFYDKEQYARQQDYFKVNKSLRKCYFYAHVDTYSNTAVYRIFRMAERQKSGNNIFACFVGFSVFRDRRFGKRIDQVLPVEWYETFVIEERFGFNRMTKCTFILDKIKSLLLTALIGGMLLGLTVYLYEIFGQMFWISACCAVMLVLTFMSLFYSQWIVPVFNKQTPLESGELRNAIEDFASKAGFQIHDIYVIDGSRRSTKANAYFSGWGATKRIVLYDTLIQDLSVHEIVAVLAHEMGHCKHNDTLKMWSLSIFNVLLLFFLFSLTIDNTYLAGALGSRESSFMLSLVAFSLLYTPVSLVTGLVINSMTRRAEYAADLYAASCGLAVPLIEGLKKISVKSLTNLTPDKRYVWFYYSHPTLLQRMANLNKRKDLL